MSVLNGQTVSPMGKLDASFKQLLSIILGATIVTLTMMFPYLPEIPLYRDQNKEIFADWSSLCVTTLRR